MHLNFSVSKLRKKDAVSLALNCGQMPLEIPNTHHRLLGNDLNLFAWDSVCNYGDYLGPLLFQAATQRSVHVESRKLNPVIDAGPDRVIYCFLGTMAQLLKGNSKFIILGMGVSGANENTGHGDQELTPGLDLDVRALRGRLSLLAFERAGYSVSNDVAFGDPALMLPGLIELKLQTNPTQLYNLSLDKRIRLGLIPHHSRVAEYRERFPDFKIIDPKTCNPHSLRKFIEIISSLDAVITSSLHVAILCETLGKPVGVLEPRNRFKFDDFYSSIGKKTPYMKESQLVVGETITLSWRSFHWDSEHYLSKFPFKLASIFAKRVSNHFKVLAELNPVSMVFDLKSDYFIEFESSSDHTANLSEDNVLQKLNELDFTVADYFEHGYRSYAYSDWVDISNHELLVFKFEGLNTGVRIWLQSDEFETFHSTF